MMTPSEYKSLNGEHLCHTVWVVRNNQPIGIMDQTIEGVAKLIAEYGDKVIKIECNGYTQEEKTRECERWGCE